MSKILDNKIKTKKAKIAVLGLGYVGLPLAVSFAKAGFQVFGLDKDNDRVSKVQQKVNYILDIQEKVLASVVNSGKLQAGTDFSVLKETDIAIVCVPTPLKRKYTPDISFILDSVRTLCRYIHKDMLIVLESTTYPGTTEELIKPELEKSGLKAEKDFYLAFSPERIDPGNKNYDVTRIPKLVGGLTKYSGLLTQKLYSNIIASVHLVSSARAAEMTKLLENSFRIINIGWINEVAMMCHHMGLDVWEIIEAAKTKPFGYMPFYPGLGVGGHCIPDDPLYLFWKAKRYGFHSKYIKLSADTNTNMPAYAVSRLEMALQPGKKLQSSNILVLGVTYKKDVKDLRKSPSLKLIELLQKTAKKVDYYDPLIPYLKIDGIDNNSIKLTPGNLKKYDAVVIATDHTAVNYEMVRRNSRRIFDTRNIFGAKTYPNVIKL